MSRENVDVVREVFNRAFVDRDFDAVLMLFHSDAVLDWSNSRAPYSGVYHGHAEIRTSWEEWTDAWEEWNPEIREAFEVDDETVVIATFVRARGKGSGVSVEAHGASVWLVREGKVARGKLFQSKSAALEAAGLSE